MSSIFKSDVFEWARDLAIIHRIFGTTRASSMQEDMAEPPPRVVPFGEARRERGQATADRPVTQVTER